MGLEDFVREKLPWTGREEENRMLTAGAAVLAGVATRYLLRALWRSWKGEEPPANPASASVDWGDAIAWTVAVSVAVGTARLVARRGAAAASDSLGSS